MTVRHGQGEAIEGAKISGQSRKPLRAKGTEVRNGINCAVFMAEFDVGSKVEESLAPSARKIIDSSLTQENDSLLCRKAFIYTLKPRRMSEEVSHGSSTHKTNKWRFSSHTAVQIDQPRDIGGP